MVTVDEPPEDATPLELIRWAIEKRGLPPALKQITDKELRVCQLMYYTLHYRKQGREKVRALTRRIKLARKLQSLLAYRLPDLDGIIALDEWLLNPEGDLPSGDFIPLHSRAVAATDVIVTKLLRRKKFSNDKVVSQLSAFEMVAGWIIPSIFETHCGSAAGYTRNGVDDCIRSEFVDFAEYVLAVLGIRKSDGTPYERRSIEAALTKCRRLRNQ